MNAPYLPPSTKRGPSLTNIILNAVIGGAFGWLVGLAVSILVAWLAACYLVGEWFELEFWDLVQSRAAATLIFLASVWPKLVPVSEPWRQWMSFDLIWWWHKISLLTPAIIAGAWSGWKEANKSSQSAERVISGSVFTDDPKEALKALQRGCRVAIKNKKNPDVPGVVIHPGAESIPPIRIPMRHETTHFFIGGAAGAGKTQMMQNLIRSADQRGDRLFVYDFKSDDFTSWFRSRYGRDGDAVLLSPWDENTWIWDIAADVEYLSDTTVLASSLLPKPSNASDDYWNSASRDIMDVVITYLRAEFGKDWGFIELAAMFNDIDLVRYAAQEVDPGALAHVTGESPQTQGVIGAIRDAGKWLGKMAALWIPRKNRMFSIQDYVYGRTDRRVVVLGANQRFEFFHPVVACITSIYLALKTGAEKETGGRQWGFLDELGTLPKIENLTVAMTNARSKGLRIVIGIQDLGVLQKVYGREIAATIFNQCSTRVVGGARESEGLEFFSKAFGQQVVERPNITIQPRSGGASDSIIDMWDGSNLPASSGWQRDQREVIHTGIIEGLNPLHFLVRLPACPDEVLHIQWPYQQLPGEGQQAIRMRKAMKMKRWPSPFWLIQKFYPKRDLNPKAESEQITSKAEQKQLEQAEEHSVYVSGEQVAESQEEGTEEGVMGKMADLALDTTGNGFLSEILSGEGKSTSDVSSHVTTKKKKKGE